MVSLHSEAHRGNSDQESVFNDAEEMGVGTESLDLVLDAATQQLAQAPPPQKAGQPLEVGLLSPHLYTLASKASPLPSSQCRELESQPLASSLSVPRLPSHPCMGHRDCPPCSSGPGAGFPSLPAASWFQKRCR